MIGRAAWRWRMRRRRLWPAPQRGHGPPPLVRARPGPLDGKRVLLVVAPTDCAGAEVRALERRLSSAGARVGVGCETPAEARDERRRPIAVHRLLVEVRPADWDALVYVGGAGAARVAEDEFARSLGREFAEAREPVAAVGRGAAVLARAGLDGIRDDDPVRVADAVAAALERAT